MKKFQQNKVAMKIALSFMLGSALFLGACGNGGEDSELKDFSYYKKNIKEAKTKLNWCLEKAKISSNLIEEIKKLNKEMKYNLIELKVKEYDKAINQAKEEGIIDKVNERNCGVVINFYDY